MYEPIRTGPAPRSVHSGPMAGPPSDFPHRSREEELDIQLAGHLAALLAVTDELRALAPAGELDAASARLAEQVTRLRGGAAPARATATATATSTATAATSTATATTAPTSTATATATEQPPAALHRRAHALAGRALVVAASRADTTAAILSAERMDAHAAALTGLAEGGAGQKELSAAH
ncbi:hypothetical protein ACFC09_06430 [Streptomyces sp. NPDC056161]|uniref:SCO4983 family protein n=1 Tax=Streptomyces sp. NPDC056161 TaxID=3345732 RepID=UPI0035DD6522